MPNWCFNKIAISPSKEPETRKQALAQFKEFIEKFRAGNAQKKEGENDVFFGVFFPTPQDLQITAGSSTDYGMAVILSQQFNDHSKIDEIRRYPWGMGKTREELIKELTEGKGKSANLEEGMQAIKNLKKYGCKDWYDWNCDNWGTKWDLLISNVKYDLKRKKMTMFADSARSPPIEGLCTVSKDYPLLIFKIKYSEEGNGFRGEDVIQDGWQR